MALPATTVALRVVFDGSLNDKTMRIIPVLDLLKGHIVRGVGGRRAEYRPIVSTLTDSSQPVETARALAKHFGLNEFYLADLEALAGAPPALETYAALRREGFALWVDAGLRDAGDADPLISAGVDGIIAGLETLRGPEALTELTRLVGSESLLFSLDLKDGRPLGDLSRWRQPDVHGIARQVVELGVQRILLLDLGRVGMGQGTGTEHLRAELREAFPALEIWAGGGVPGLEDLRRLQEQGTHAVLVASALHDGRIQPEHLRNL